VSVGHLEIPVREMGASLMTMRRCEAVLEADGEWEGEVEEGEVLALGFALGLVRSWRSTALTPPMNPSAKVFVVLLLDPLVKFFGQAHLSVKW
jgi:hypothetical protein